MARSITHTLRKLGKAGPTEPPADDAPFHRHDAYDRDDEETQHDRYRRKQQRMAEQDTSSSLPIKAAEKEVKPKPGMRFEGPIDKLIEKYKDPREVVRHLTMGQHMRYELRGAQIWEGDALIYDGTEHIERGADR